MIRPTGLAALLILLSASPALAESWAEALFPVKRHDFGVVARNAKTEYVFEIENCYATDLHIAGVRASCGCTTPYVLQHDLTTYQRGGIRVVFNTDSFVGHRGATITVTFDRPRFAEVQLRVDGEIRGDVTTEPRGFEFGSVDLGAKARRELLVSYHGPRSDWRIEEVRAAGSHVTVRAEPVSSTTAGRAFRLIATWDSDAPPGYYSEPVILVTNDPTAREIPVQVTARVQPPLTVNPSQLFFGVVRTGSRATRQLVVIGPEPFRILAIDCDDCFRCEVTDVARRIHVIPLTFTAGKRSGRLQRTLTVRTDLGGGCEATCTASAAIVDERPADAT